MAEPTNRYDLPAARAHGRPGREVRPRSLTADIHSHIASVASFTEADRAAIAGGNAKALFGL